MPAARWMRRHLRACRRGAAGQRRGGRQGSTEGHPASGAPVAAGSSVHAAAVHAERSHDLLWAAPCRAELRRLRERVGARVACAPPHLPLSGSGPHGCVRACEGRTICKKGAARRLPPRCPPPWWAERRSVRRSAASTAHACTASGQGLLPLAGAKRAVVARRSGAAWRCRLPAPRAMGTGILVRPHFFADVVRCACSLTVAPPPFPPAAIRVHRRSITPAPFEARLPC